MMTELKKRRLGIHEETFWHLDKAMPINVTIAAKIEGVVSDEEIRSAIDAVQARHPLLRARITIDKLRPYFIPCDRQIPLEITEGDDTKVSKIIDTFTNEVFDTESGPLVRAALVRYREDLLVVVFGLHHAITDGRSMVLVINDLMHALAKQKNGQSAELDELPTEAPYEQGLPITSKGILGYLKWLFVVNRLYLRIFTSGLPPQHFPLKTEAPLEERQMRTFHEYIEAPQAQAIFKACKAHQVTVHCALHAAFALSAAELINKEKTIPLFLGTIADLRSHVKPTPSQASGLFAAVMGAAHRVNCNEDFWLLAKRVQKQLRKDRALNVSHVLSKFQFLPINWLARRLSKEKVCKLFNILASAQPKSIPLSNLGLITVLDDLPSSLHVKEIRGSVSASIFGDLSGGALTLNDRIYTFIGAAIPTVDEQQLQKYQKRANVILINASTERD